MVTVNDLRNYGDSLKSRLEQINYNKTVIDDSQMVKDLGDISPENKHLLYLVIPDNNNVGVVDSILKNNQIQFIVLCKTSYDITHEEFLDIIHDTQQTARLVEKTMFQDKYDAQVSYEDSNNQECGFMMWLDTSSISMKPIWDYEGCHGWTISFSMKTKI